ncbi:MAG: YciI family protein [Nitratireductor sp.]|nr:YciI family protein [Nitratireductor sp.]
MLFVVHALDHEDAVQRRLANYEAHKSYLASSAMKTVISGPLLADDGETMIGSLFVVEAASKDDVIAFNRDDPFAAANVWKEVSIHPFNKRVDNR